MIALDEAIVIGTLKNFDLEVDFLMYLTLVTKIIDNLRMPCQYVFDVITPKPLVQSSKT